MSQENVEMARRGAEAFNAAISTGGCLSSSLPISSGAPRRKTPMLQPIAAGRLSGLSAAVDGQFDGLHADVEEYIDAGDDQVFTWDRWTVRGRASGVDADWHHAVIYTLRDGRVVAARSTFTAAEALEAVGLSE